MSDITEQIGNDISNSALQSYSGARCWITSVGVGVATGALGGSALAGVGAAPGAALGAIVGILVGLKACRPDGIIRQGMERGARLTENRPPLSDQEIQHLSQAIQERYGTNRSDSNKLAKLAIAYNASGSPVLPSNAPLPLVRNGIQALLKSIG